MTAVYDTLLPALWLLWGLYWLWMSRGGKRVERIESVASRLAHVLPLILVAWLLAAPRVPLPWLSTRILAPGAPHYFAGVAITVLGLLHTIWARAHLGDNWSGMVTVKDGHELVRSGPYRWTRHPIYTGLLLAFAGSALARAEWRGILALLIAFLALWRKSRLEERWMAERFGEAYAVYRREVKALVPGLF